jgi:hypothetical protein
VDCKSARGSEWPEVGCPGRPWLGGAGGGDGVSRLRKKSLAFRPRLTGAGGGDGVSRLRKKSLAVRPRLAGHCCD